ncbi:RT0821/Lpp0805 family surface protein [Blastochloris sulfoviridis]|uniref:Surface antigen domain-containing protein n=1 Tax=Blastochloris sulfoviridis TaxID=50712 RepID=A0A5M6HWR9_9HYPH|nr:RT0821/Lpp0805 family surface protein [Blastochloris sulfoviridis]KAA5600360.1 hypothetical protein F1193_10680 [Blastochloris sulfoviridis]
MAVGLGLLLSGCAAISIPMGGLFGDDADDTTVTGSVKTPPALTPVPDMDWRAARGALSQAMSRTDAGASVMWDNPLTGARGSITPLSAAVASAAGKTCRTFLLSRVFGDNETWHQGEACLNGKHGWKVQAVRPLAVKT